MKDKKDVLVILDLDETLIHSRREPLERAPDFFLDPLSVYFRPSATELISALAQKFELAVWSAGSPLYVDTVVQTIFPEGINPLFVWNRDHCTQKFEFFPFQILFTKDLNKMEDFGFDLTRTFIIEDDLVKVSSFADNALIVSQYFGEDFDDELTHLVSFFENLNGDTNDVHKMVSSWKDRVRNPS